MPSDEEKKKTDYTAPTGKVLGAEGEEPRKKITKVVTGDVTVKKRGLGRKIKDTIIAADFKSVVDYIFNEVFIPATKNTIVDMSTKGIDRMIYGQPQRRRFGGSTPGFPQSRISYSSPVQRFSQPEPRRYGPQPPVAALPAQTRARDEFIVSSREDAELVLDKMGDIIERYEIVSIADLNDMLGWSNTDHVDTIWGWTSMEKVSIKPTRDGFIIDLPEAEYLK